MSKIRFKNTKEERIVFRYFGSPGIHFQKHYKRAPGCPDIAFPRKKISHLHRWGFLAWEELCETQEKAAEEVLARENRGKCEKRQEEQKNAEEGRMASDTDMGE